MTYPEFVKMAKDAIGFLNKRGKEQEEIVSALLKRTRALENDVEQLSAELKTITDYINSFNTEPA